MGISYFVSRIHQDVTIPSGLRSRRCVAMGDHGGSRRVELQNDLSAEEYAALMSDNVEDLTELRLWSLEKIKENKAKVARPYNKKVKPKDFQVGNLVWEAVLPLGTKDRKYGKWSPTWHGHIRLIKSCLEMRTCLKN